MATAYERFYPLCKKYSHGEINYKGDGDYECPVCSYDYHDKDYSLGYSEKELEDVL